MHSAFLWSQRARTYLNQCKSSVAVNIRLMQTLYQPHQLRIVSKRITVTSTIVGVDICTVCTEHYPFRCRRPPCRRYALLDCFFKCIGQTVPAITIVIESVEASVRSELNTKARNVSPTCVKFAVDEPGLELWGKVMSPCKESAIELSLHLTYHSERNKHLRMIFPFAFRAPRK